MFRFSDYDFEYSEKDYVAFMHVFKKFLELAEHYNEAWKGCFSRYELIENAENYALEYVNMRVTGKVSETVRYFTGLCAQSEYNNITEEFINIWDVDEIDDMLWNVYSDVIE